LLSIFTKDRLQSKLQNADIPSVDLHSRPYRNAATSRSAALSLPSVEPERSPEPPSPKRRVTNGGLFLEYDDDCIARLRLANRDGTASVFFDLNTATELISFMRAHNESDESFKSHLQRFARKSVRYRCTECGHEWAKVGLGDTGCAGCKAFFDKIESEICIGHLVVESRKVIGKGFYVSNTGDLAEPVRVYQHDVIVIVQRIDDLGDRRDALIASRTHRQNSETSEREISQREPRRCVEEWLADNVSYLAEDLKETYFGKLLGFAFTAWLLLGWGVVLICWSLSYVPEADDYTLPIIFIYSAPWALVLASLFLAFIFAPYFIVFHRLRARQNCLSECRFFALTTQFSAFALLYLYSQWH